MGRDHADIVIGNETALAAHDNLCRGISLDQSIQDDHGLSFDGRGVLAPEAM